MVQRILVGTDGSEDSHHAVVWCAEFARNSDVEVVVCHVIAASSEWLLSAAQVDFQKVEREHRRLLLGPWTEPLRAAGVTYDVVQVSGDPVRTLLDVAEHKDVDLIAIGKAGHGAAAELFLGGTAAKLTHRTTRPLLVVPPRRAPHETKRHPVVEERNVPLPG